MLGFRRPTFIERFFAFVRIPYIVGCLLLATVLGPPGAILSCYIQNNNLSDSVSSTIYLFFGVYFPFWQGVAGLAVLYVFLFYLLYMIRYMRLKLVTTELVFLSLLPEGEETINNIFGRVSRVIPPIVLGSLLSVGASLATKGAGNFIVFCSDMGNLIYLVFALPFFCIAFCTFVWVYCTSIEGLHELGKKPLKLKPFYEDRLLGLKPIGALSLSFAFAYFLGMGMLTLYLVLGSPNPEVLFYLLLLSSITVLGVVLFVLPLFTFHNKMVEVKNREQKVLREQFAEAMKKSSESSTPVSESSASETEKMLGRLTKIVVSDITIREIEEMTTWPFDIPILRRLFASIVSMNVVIFVVDLILRMLMNSS